MAGNPLYITAKSSGPSPWVGVDTGIAPQNLAWQLIFTSTLATIANLEATLDNPFTYGSTNQREGGLAIPPSSQSPVPIILGTYASSTLGQTPQLLTLNDGLMGGTAATLLSSQFGGPIYAWRVNLTTSNAATYVTFYQAGKKN